MIEDSRGTASSLVRLREVAADDLPIFFEHQSDPGASQMADFPFRERETYMAHWKKIMNDPTTTLRTVMCGGHVAGNVVSWEESGHREVGYWLGREFWGKGVGTQALALFLEVETWRPLYAHVARHNIGSIRVLEKCGFEILSHGSAASGAAGDELNEFLLRLER